MDNLKKFFLIFLILIFFLPITFGFVFARDLEITYPAIGNVPVPSTTRTLLPDYVNYIFNFAIYISGFVVFGVIIFAGFKYLTSTGNATAMADARDQIFNAIIGMLILLASYLILTTINPQLVVINPILNTQEGVILYTTAGCPGGRSPESQIGARAGETYLKLGVSSRTLEGLNEVRSIWTYKSSDDLKINLYPQTDWEGTPVPVIGQANTCVDSPLISAKSIELGWQNPGVYLCKDVVIDSAGRITDGRNCSVYNSPQPKLAEGFNDEVVYIKFKDSPGSQYGAVLHEHVDYEGVCQEFSFASQVSLRGRRGAESEASSITVFLRNTAPQGTGITLYSRENYQGSQFGPATSSQGSLGEFSDDARSVTIDGDYMALLFRNSENDNNLPFGECEVLKDNDQDLKNNYVTDIGWEEWGNINTVSAFTVIPIKK